MMLLYPVAVCPPAARQLLTSKFTPRLEAKKVPYQAEIVRFATDNDSIGEQTVTQGLRFEAWWSQGAAAHVLEQQSCGLQATSVLPAPCLL
jgi:hypothetical protein